MRSRLERIELLRNLLIQRDFWIVSELAENLGVSSRTLFRDLALLRNMGLHIESDRGTGGGIRLLSSWSSRKVELTEAQTLRLLISVAVIEKFGLPLFSGGKASIQARLLAGIPRHLSPPLARLKSRVFVGGSASEKVRLSCREPLSDPLAQLERAFVETQNLEIEYRDESNRKSVRRIEPHGLMVNFPAWYVLAFDHLRQDLRTFRVDRIRKARALPGTRFNVRAQAIFEELIGKEFGEPL